MYTIAAIAITCWCCALVAAPRRPLPGNEVQELVYVRLLGRHQRLVLVAFVVTAVAFLTNIAISPGHIHRATRDALERRQVCSDVPMQRPTCYTPRPDGAWAVEQMQNDGAWLTAGVVSHPPADTEGTGR